MSRNKPTKGQEPQPTETDTLERIGIRQLLDAIRVVVLDNRPMAEGREGLKKWFAALPDEDRQLISPFLFQKAEQMKVVAEAVYGEFTDLSNPYRS